MIESPLALLAFMFVVVAFARRLEDAVPIIQRISSAVVCTLLGILLANVGVIPHTSPIHDGVYRYAVPYAIVLVILSSKLKDLKAAGGPLLVAFLLAGLGSFVGAVGSSFLFASKIGPETWKLGGTFAGAFWGGGMNFAAVGQGLEVTPSLFAAAFVVDNLSTVPWMLTQVGLFTLLARFYPTPKQNAEAGADDEPVPEKRARAADEPDDVRKQWTEATTSILDLAFLAAVPLAFLWLAEWIAGAGIGLLTSIPQVLWLTTFALIAAQIPVVQRLRGAAMLSYFALHLFFITIGATSNVREVLNAGPWLFLYMIVIIAVHAIVVYGVGFVARLDLPTITIASQAAVGGPGSALALGMAMKWTRLVTPGIIIGIFGYAVGNYLGFATAWVLNQIL
jgi:uncharacterized membrane protein